MPLLTNGFHLGSLIVRDDVTTPWRNGPIRAGLALALTDVRITLEEVSFLSNYTNSAVDLRAAIQTLYSDALGPIDWVDTRLLSDGAAAFREIHEGKAAAPKIVLQP
jgi:hypothetical protein